MKANLVEDDLDAMRAVVWILKKRQTPTLRYGEFDPGVDEMVTRFDKTEVENWVDGVFGLLGVDPDVTIESVALALREVPGVSADPDYARTYIEKRQAEAEASGGKGPAPDAEPTEAAPARTKSAKRTSQTSAPSS